MYSIFLLTFLYQAIIQSSSVSILMIFSSWVWNSHHLSNSCASYSRQTRNLLLNVPMEGHGIVAGLESRIISTKATLVSKGSDSSKLLKKHPTWAYYLCKKICIFSIYMYIFTYTYISTHRSGFSRVKRHHRGFSASGHVSENCSSKATDPQRCLSESRKYQLKLWSYSNERDWRLKSYNMIYYIILVLYLYTVYIRT